MSKCLYCYQDIQEPNHQEYHTQCAEEFYGVPTALILPYNQDEIAELAKQVVQRSVTVPGVQPKLSMGVNNILQGKATGRLTILDAFKGLYILKPQNEYPSMPENEHLSMKLAQLMKIDVVPSTLIRLQSGELCYLTKRIDRTPDGKKLHMIDFHQLLELKGKYMGTMEQVGKKIGELSAHVLLDKFRFFELAVFNFVIGNNDMHLKNFSMILSNGKWLLAPAYDLLNVQIVLPTDKDEVALLLGGKKKNQDRAYFERFGKILGLNDKQIRGVFRRLEKWLVPAQKLIHQSFLPTELQTQYEETVLSRMARLRG